MTIFLSFSHVAILPMLFQGPNCHFPSKGAGNGLNYATNMSYTSRILVQHFSSFHLFASLVFLYRETPTSRGLDPQTADLLFRILDQFTRVSVSQDDVMSGLVEVNNRLSSLVLCPAPPPPEESWLGLTYEETMLLYGIFSFFLVLLAVTLTWHRMSRPLVISLRDLDPRLHQADGRLSFRVEDDVPNDGWTTRDNGWPPEENWDNEDNAVIPELLEAPAVDAVLQALAEAPAPLAQPEDASLETPQMSPEESWPTAAQPA